MDGWVSSRADWQFEMEKEGNLDAHDGYVINAAQITGHSRLKIERRREPARHQFVPDYRYSTASRLYLSSCTL